MRCMDSSATHRACHLEREGYAWQKIRELRRQSTSAQTHSVLQYIYICIFKEPIVGYLNGNEKQVDHE